MKKSINIAGREVPLEGVTDEQASALLLLEDIVTLVDRCKAEGLMDKEASVESKSIIARSGLSVVAGYIEHFGEGNHES